MGCCLVVEVHTVLLLLYFEDSVVSVMLQNLLLQEIEGLLVLHELAYLDSCSPGMWSKLLFAVLTL